MARRNLLVELPQLREMLLAIESTEVAEQHQDGRTAKESAGGKDFAVGRHEVEVEVDPHRKHDASFPAPICDQRHRYMDGPLAFDLALHRGKRDDGRS